MLTVTDDARDRLSQKLAHKKATYEVALRFTRRRGGWRLRLDQARPADTTFTHKGRNILLLDDVVARAMQHMTLDTRTTEAGPQLRLRRRTSKED